MSERYKKVCKVLNYFEHFVIFISAVSGCASISAFAWLVGIPIGITSFALGLKICAITAGIKKDKSIIKKKRKNNHIVLLAKTKLNSINVLIPKALTDCMLIMMSLFQ